MADFAVLSVVGLILGLSVGYIYKEKKKGKSCIGCPYGSTCGGSCSGCGSVKK